MKKSQAPDRWALRTERVEELGWNSHRWSAALFSFRDVEECEVQGLPSASDHACGKATIRSNRRRGEHDVVGTRAPRSSTKHLKPAAKCRATQDSGTCGRSLDSVDQISGDAALGSGVGSRQSVLRPFDMVEPSGEAKPVRLLSGHPGDVVPIRLSSNCRPRIEEWEIRGTDGGRGTRGIGLEERSRPAFCAVKQAIRSWTRYRNQLVAAISRIRSMAPLTTPGLLLRTRWRLIRSVAKPTSISNAGWCSRFTCCARSICSISIDGPRATCRRWGAQGHLLAGGTTTRPQARRSPRCTARVRWSSRRTPSWLKLLADLRLGVSSVSFRLILFLPSRRKSRRLWKSQRKKRRGK